MKKLSILFISALALGISFASCSKDDDNAPASVEGKWNYSKMSLTVGSTETPEVDYPTDNSSCGKDYLELKADGVANEGSYEGTACTLDVFTSKWKQDGNKITVDDTVYEILSSTGSVLKLKSTYTESGQTFTVTVTLVKA